MTQTTGKHIDDESRYDVAWSRTSEDYATHRAGFPVAFYERLAARGLLPPGARAVDLGTGTGTVALGLADRGLEVVGLDVAEGQLAQARRLAGARPISFVCAPAEDTGLASGRFDLAVAGQCWHWFDRPRAAAEAMRLLAPGGAVVIAHLDWLEREANLVARTVALVEAHRQIAIPHLDEVAVRGFYPYWLDDLHAAGFAGLETFGFDVELPYAREAWRGRMRASALVGASMDEATVARFDGALAAELRHEPEPLAVPHRIFVALGRKEP